LLLVPLLFLGGEEIPQSGIEGWSFLHVVGDARLVSKFTNKKCTCHPYGVLVLWKCKGYKHDTPNGVKGSKSSEGAKDISVGKSPSKRKSNFQTSPACRRTGFDSGGRFIVPAVPSIPLKQKCGTAKAQKARVFAGTEAARYPLQLPLAGGGRGLIFKP